MNRGYGERLTGITLHRCAWPCLARWCCCDNT